MVKEIDPRVVRVPVASLVPGDSPRLEGEDPNHVHVLLQTESDLPPIVVHRSSMRVIDGMHRLRVAMLRGDESIRVRFFDGDDEAAFLLAVQANIAHGLPLSYADREAAAARIIRSHPERSDRWIAKVAGLGHKTVAALRQRLADQVPPTSARTGLDGKVRPLNANLGRVMASELLAQQPGISLRQVAQAAGVSLGTVHDVQERMRRGEDPVPPGRNIASSDQTCGEHPARRGGTRWTAADKDPRTQLDVLRRDPSLRFNDTGRNLLRWLDRYAVGSRDWSDLVESVPPHSLGELAELARNVALVWQDLAEHIERRRSMSMWRDRARAGHQQ